MARRNVEPRRHHRVQPEQTVVVAIALLGCRAHLRLCRLTRQLPLVSAGRRHSSSGRHHQCGDQRRILDGSPSKPGSWRTVSNRSTAQGRLLFVREGALMAQPFDQNASSPLETPFRSPSRSRLCSQRKGRSVSVSETEYSPTGRHCCAALYVDLGGLPTVGKGRRSAIHTSWLEISGFLPDERASHCDLRMPTTSYMDLRYRHVEFEPGSPFDSATDSNPVWSRDGRASFSGPSERHYRPVPQVSGQRGPPRIALRRRPSENSYSWSPTGRLCLYHANQQRPAYDGRLNVLEAASDGPGECVL